MTTNTDMGSSDGPLCVCGHYDGGHDETTNDLGFRSCHGTVGNDRCTCQGFRPARSERG
jgi:hypothetical protein